MSGICGIINLDGRPPDLDLLRAMSARMSHRGPDGIHHWVQGSVAIAHAALHTTPESLHEVQPLTNPSGNLCLTFDGRVDNREELKAAVEDKSIVLRSDTDAELVLRAYEAWGGDCAAKILGDFAFAIWDGASQQLFCARDIMGIKPFYYFHDGKRFLFASELAQILEAPAVGRGVNEGMVGEFLSASITSREDTLYSAISRLPPAHFLVVGPRKFRKQRYWDIDLQRQLRYRRPEEYSDQFFEIFKEAVRCCMRSNGPVGAELSGGLDSSSVVGMAQWLLREGAVPAQRFETFSDVFPGLACDETPYIQQVAGMWGFYANLIPASMDSGKFAEDVHQNRYIPMDPTCMLGHHRSELQAKRGFRVILNGSGGDDWLAGDEYPHADLLRSFKIRALLRQVRSDWAIWGPAESIRFSLKRAVVPLLPETLRAGLRKVRTATGRARVAWIPAEFAKRIDLDERVLATFRGRNFQTDRQKARFWYLANGLTTFAWELWDRSLTRYGIEQRSPFCDRRVIEFAFALPQEQLCVDGLTKIVLRNALREQLPKSVRERTDKAEFSVAFVDALECLGGERLFDSLYIESLNMVDGTKIRAMSQQLLANHRKDRNCTSEHTWPLWMAFAVELWFSIMGGEVQVCQNC